MSHDFSNKYPNKPVPAAQQDMAIDSPKRRHALKTLVQGAATVLTGVALTEQITTSAQAQAMGMMGGMMGGMPGQNQSASISSGLFTHPMPIPPQLKGEADSSGVRTYALNVMAGQHSELVPGLKTATWGYNGAILGPTIRVPQGKPVRFDISNGLDQSTTVHWHGAHVPGHADGGPHNLIAAGKQTSVSFSLNQPAATLWYHPHPDGRTGPQVYAGLAGFLLVDDGLDARLGMPHTYGVDDLPVVIQDRRITETGQLDYMNSMMDIMGMKGDRFLVNGIEQPFVAVPGQWIRLRLLNGSNARIYNLCFADERPFHVVASDAGLLEQPVERTELVLAPAERAEIMVDLGDMQGKKLVLRSDSAKVIPGLNRMPMATDGYDKGHFDLLELRVGAPTAKTGHLPERMASIPTLKADAPIRKFTLQDMNMGKMRRMMMGGGLQSDNKSTGPGGMSMGIGGRHLFSINDQYMNPKVINERVKLGSTEIWHVANDGMMAHPFHIHGISFQVLSRDGAQPPAYERGWKDVVLVHSGQTVQLIARFDQPAGDDHPFMYHCHILEHEDNGMMGQFTVS